MTNPFPLAQDFGNELAANKGFEIVSKGVVVPGVLEYDLTGRQPWARVATGGTDKFDNKLSEIKQLDADAFVRAATSNTGPHWGAVLGGDYLGCTTEAQARRQASVDNERRFFVIDVPGSERDDPQALANWETEGGLVNADFNEVERRVFANSILQGMPWKAGPPNGGSVTGRYRHDVANPLGDPKCGVKAAKPRTHLDAILEIANKDRMWECLYGQFDAEAERKRKANPTQRDFDPSAICQRIRSFELNTEIGVIPGTMVRSAKREVTINIVVDASATPQGSDRKLMAEIAEVLARHYPRVR